MSSILRPIDTHALPQVSMLAGPLDLPGQVSVNGCMEHKRHSRSGKEQS